MVVFLTIMTFDTYCSFLAIVYQSPTMNYDEVSVCLPSSHFPFILIDYYT
jgi:hypothetical protein